MANRKTEFLASIKPILDKSQARKDAEELATELQDILSEKKIGFDADSLKQIGEMFNEQLKELGKKPIVFSDIEISDGALKEITARFTQAISDGIKAGVADISTSLTNDVVKQLEDLRNKKDELNKYTDKLNKRMGQLERLQDMSSMYAEDYKPLKAEADIDEQANRIMGAFIKAEEKLNGLTSGTKEYNTALVNAFEAAYNLYAMSQTLNKNKDKVKDKSLLSDFDFMTLKDTTYDLFENYEASFNKFLQQYYNLWHKEITKISNEIKQIDIQIQSIEQNNIEIINQEKAKSALKSLNEIEEAYNRILNKDKSVNKKKSKEILSAIEYTPNSNSLAKLEKGYLGSVESGASWEEQYQWLVKFVKEYDDHAQKIEAEGDSKKRANMKRTLREYTELYKQLSPIAENAENSLRNVLNMANKTPLVGNSDAEHGTSSSTEQVNESLTEQEKLLTNIEKLTSYIDEKYLSTGKHLSDFLNDLQRESVELDTELKEILSTLRLIDENGNLTFDIKHSGEQGGGTTHNGALISDDFVMIERANYEAVKDSKLPSSTQEAHDNGINVAEVLGYIKSKTTDAFFDVQATAKGHNIFENGVLSQDVVNATEEQLEQLVRAFIAARDYGFNIENGGSNIVYDKEQGFSFYDLEELPSEDSEWWNKLDDDKKKLYALEDLFSLFSGLNRDHTNFDGDKNVKGFASRLKQIIADKNIVGLEAQFDGRNYEDIFNEIFPQDGSAVTDKNADQFWEEIRQEATAHRENAEAIEQERLAQERLNNTREQSGIGVGDTSSEDLKAAQEKAKQFQAQNEALQSDLDIANEQIKIAINDQIVAENETERIKEQLLSVECDRDELFDQNWQLEEELRAKDVIIQELRENLSQVIDAGALDLTDGNGTTAGTAGAIDTEALKNVLSAITYNVKVVQDTDAPDSEKTSLIDIEALKTALNSITYNAKIVSDDADKSANKIAIDDSSLEQILQRVFGNILNPTTQQNDGNAQEPWALEQTLQSVKGVLDSIKEHTAKIGAIEIKQPTTTTVGNVLATENTLAAIKATVEAINGKVVKGTKATTSNDTGKAGSGKKNAESYSSSQFFPEKLKTQTMYLAKFRAQLMTTGKLTDDVDARIYELLDGLSKIQNGPDFSKWNQQFLQLKTSVGITDIFDKAVDKEVITSYQELISYQKIRNKLELQYEKAKDGSAVKQFYQEQLAQMDNVISKQAILNKNDEQEAKLAEIKKQHERELGALRASKVDQQVDIQKRQQEAEVVRQLVDLYEQLGRAQALGEDTSAIRTDIKSRRSNLTSVDYATDMKFKHAKDKGVDAVRVAQENAQLQEQKNIIAGLKKLYQEYGVLKERANAVQGEQLADQLGREVSDKLQQIQEAEKLLGKITPELRKEFDGAFTHGQKIESDRQYEALARNMDAERAKSIKDLGKTYEKLGVAQAKFAQTGSHEVANEVSSLENIIASEKERLNLTAQQIADMETRLNLAREEAKLNLEAQVRERTRKHYDREEEKAQKKALQQRIKQSKEDARLNRANSAFNAGSGALASLWRIDDNTVNIEEIDAVQKLDKALEELKITRNNVNKEGHIITPEEAELLKNQTVEVDKYTEQVKELINNYERFSGDNAKKIGTVVEGADLQDQLTKAFMEMANGKGKVTAYDEATKTLTGTVKTGAHTFKEYTVGARNAGNAIVALAGQTKKTETFMESFKRKFSEILRYFSASSVIYKVFNELRKGIQYIREIDAALVELRKVTDETEETYDKFLDTAAKTADRLGSTISQVTEATATFAKLGYEMEMASEMAEAAIVYKNVGDNIASTEDAADSIISTLKGFGLEASESMRIVDRFNEVGNRFAITSQGIGEALRLSASALNEGGNTLDESIGIITAANEVVNDPSSVGTALKTLTLRLRGAKTELEEMGEDVSDMAITTSSLQAKLLALTGGQVNIMLDENTFKSSTQILREMAAAWESMTDVQQASALELMGGKRQANVLSALIQNFDTAEAAIEASANSAGSALRENEVYLDSIQGRIDLFNNSVQTMWKNTLDDDVVKTVVDIGTVLVKLVDNVGLLRIAFMGLGVYLMRRFNIGDILKPGTESLEQMRKTLASLKEEAKKATDDDFKLRTEKSAKKKEIASKRVADYELQIQPYEEANALKEKQNELIAKQAEAQAAVNQANNEFIVATREGADPVTLQAYSNNATQAKAELVAINTELDATNAKLTTVGVSADTTGKKGATGFKKFGASLKSFGKQLGQIAIQMFAMYAITAVLESISKGIEAIKTAIDDAIETPEEAKEKFEQLNSELAQCQSELRSLESEFEIIKDQIGELNSKGSLSFVDEQELERLQKESAELERQITLKKVLQSNLQRETNSAAINSTNKYLTDTSFGSTETKSERQEKAREDGETWGTVAGLALGAALAIFIPGVGLALGAAMAGAGALIGKEIGGVIAEEVEGSAYNNEQSVGDAIDNMVNDRAALQAKVDEAFANKDTEAYSKAVEDLNNYDQMMAQHMSEIQATVNAIDYDTATDDQKKQVDLWNDLLDKYAITMGASGAKGNAINRIFAREEFEEVALEIDKISVALENETISAEDADTQIQALIESSPELKKKLEELGIETEEVADSFVKMGEAAAETKSKLSGVLDPLSNAETALKSLGDAFDEFDEKGIVTASTLADLQDKFGSFDGFEDFISVLGDSSSTTEEVTQAISDMASEYLLASGILSDITDENKAFVLSQLESLGVTNAEEYLNSIKGVQDAMAAQYGVDLSNYGTVEEMKAVIAGTLHNDIMGIQGDTLDELATNYGYDLSNFKSVEEAKTYIAVQEAKKRAQATYESTSYEADAAAIRDGTKVGDNEIEYWTGADRFKGMTYSELKAKEDAGTLNNSWGSSKQAKEWLRSVEANYNKSIEDAKKAAEESYNETINNIDGIYEQTLSLDDYIAQYNPTLSFDVSNLGGGEDPEKTKQKEAEDAFQNAMNYWENRISANQAKYEQVQNEIDLLEAKGQRAGAEYYAEQIKLENQRKALLDDQKAEALEYLKTLQDGTDEWWEVANTINDIEGELDDVIASVQELNNAVGQIRWDTFEEIHDRFSNLTTDLENIRDILSNEDMFDDEGNWTEKGVATLATYIQEIEIYKNALADVQKELADFQQGYDGNEDYFASIGIDSEQEYYDKLIELTDKQDEYTKVIKDSEQSVVEMYENQIDAIEEYTGELVDAYNDYIDVVKEALDAERDLYDFKKNVQKQTKDIASLERRIASLSGSTNAADIAERRKLEAELYDAKEGLNDTYYDHAKDQQSQALDEEAQAYEEAMNNYVEGLRTSLDEATNIMATFMTAVTSSVMQNANTVKTEYENTGLAIDTALITPWTNAANAMTVYEEDALGRMNAWTTEEGFFGKFSIDAKNQLESPWSAGIAAANNFQTNVGKALDAVGQKVETNVANSIKQLDDLKNEIDKVKDTEVRVNNSGSSENVNRDSSDNGTAASHGGNNVSNANVVALQEVLNTVFGANLTVDGKLGPNTTSAIKKAQQKIGVTVDGVYGTQTRNAIIKYIDEQIASMKKMSGSSMIGQGVQAFTEARKRLPAQLAKGTLGLTKDQFAITDESWIGEEITLAAGKNGQLQYLKKGSAVMPADISANLVEWGKLNPNMLNIGSSGANINMISNAVTKPSFELNFEALVKADRIDEGTLPEVKKFVQQEINNLVKQMNYALKIKGAK